MAELGFWTTVRINPLFPIYADGYYSDPQLAKKKQGLKLNVFSFDMIKELADYKVPSVITGFGRFLSYAMNQMSKALGIDLRSFYDGKKFQLWKDQDLWDNKCDCCNAKGRVNNFVTDAHLIPYGDRLKFSSTSTCKASYEPQRSLIDLNTLVKNPNENPFLTYGQGVRDENQK